MPTLIAAAFDSQAGIWSAGIVGVVLAVAACISLSKDKEITGGHRAMFFGLVLVFPVVGPLVYFGVRNDW